jgi:hypothetical protein
MSITLKRAKRHTEEWLTKLAPFPVRANWPVHLFHTCQLEVAVEIVKAAQITCRGSVTNLICDVANQGAVWNNPQAHNYVRLYFRPRNSFHLKTEGVKAAGDPYRVDPHMSIPIAFAFDFQKVMCLPHSGFVPGNFAKTGAAPQTGDANFDKMKFDLIYHDSAPTQERMAEVHNWRMSEVVVQNALPLDHLSYVICRTPHEERTLRYALGNHASPKIIVEQRGSIFMRRGMFVDEVYWQSNLLNMRFHGPTGYTKEKYVIKVVCWDGATQNEKSYLAAPGIYHFPGIEASKDAIWRIEIEGCVVYHAPAPSISGLITA